MIKNENDHWLHTSLGLHLDFRPNPLQVSQVSNFKALTTMSLKIYTAPVILNDMNTQCRLKTVRDGRKKAKSCRKEGLIEDDKEL